MDRAQQIRVSSGGPRTIRERHGDDHGGGATSGGGVQVRRLEPPPAGKKSDGRERDVYRDGALGGEGEHARSVHVFSRRSRDHDPSDEQQE